MKHHHIVTITKSFTGFRVVFILCCMYPVYRLKARPLCSCDGRGGRLQLEPHSAFLYCCELKAWFLFFKAQWVKSIMFDDYRSVCLILCVLNKNAGLLVCMSAPLVLVCTNRRPFVGIWCLLASPMGIVWGFSKISRECVPHQREEVRNETLHLSRSSYTAKKNAFAKLLMRWIVWRVLQYIFLLVSEKGRHMDFFLMVWSATFLNCQNLLRLSWFKKTFFAL